MKETKILLSHPFSGAMYAFFESYIQGRDVTDVKHPYYKVLYGKKHVYYRDIAMTLSLMFDRVYLSPADATLPDKESHSEDGSYFHKDTGIGTDWSIVDNNWPELLLAFDFCKNTKSRKGRHSKVFGDLAKSVV